MKIAAALFLTIVFVALANSRRVDGEKSFKGVKREEASVLSEEEVKSFFDSKRHLLSTPNVVSLAFFDEKGTRGKIFRVGVIKKLEKENINHPDIFIPKIFDHITKRNEIVTIPVKIVEEGKLVIHLGHSRAGLHPVENGAPYKGGSLIMTSGSDVVGSLGANAQYRGSYRLLSAAHVLTPDYDRDFIGREITVLEGGYFVDIGATVTDLVDVNLYDTLVPRPVYAKQDLAWADISKSNGSPEIEKIGLPGNIRKVVANERVKYYGGFHHHEGRNVQILSTNMMARFEVETSSGDIKYAFFEDLCQIEAPKVSAMGHGDSGSAIVAESDNALLGLLIGGHKEGGNAVMYFSKLML